MDQFSNAIYLLHAQILRALAHPRRLMILDCLHPGERSVGELAEALDLPQANISQHLAALRAQDIVTTRREGNVIFYSLVDPKIVEACDSFHEFLVGRMKTNQALADQFPRFRPLREDAGAPPRTGVAS